MTTLEAFNQFINTPTQYKAAGLTAQQAAMYRNSLKKKELSTDKIVELLKCGNYHLAQEANWLSPDEVQQAINKNPKQHAPK